MPYVAAEGMAELGRVWKAWHTLAVLAFIPALGAAGTLIPRAAGAEAGWGRLVSWLVIVGLMAAFAAVLGHGAVGHARAIFIDERNRISLSRVQFFLWTVIVLSGYLAAALANVALDKDRSLSISVPDALWVAMGFSTAALAVSSFVLKYREHTSGAHIAHNSLPGDAKWRDLIMGDEDATKHGIDISRLQMLLVTVILLLAYGIVLGYNFYRDTLPFTSLPDVNEAFAILLGISQGGYLVKKASPKATTTPATESTPKSVMMR